MNEHIAVTPDEVRSTVRLQAQCIDAYQRVMNSLHTGISEHEIAQFVADTLQSVGITEYWYDIPIMVFIGTDRFQTEKSTDYAVKSPSPAVTLEEGLPVFIDMHSIDPQTRRWGDFSATALYRPVEGDPSIQFALRMQEIQELVIGQTDSESTPAQVADRFIGHFRYDGIELMDVRNNFGHSMGAGRKADHARVFLDLDHKESMAGQIYAVEPGGITMIAGKTYMARFEDCIHVPEKGQAAILGRTGRLPVIFGNT